MRFRLSFIFLFSLACILPLQAQKSARKLKKEADNFIEQEKYDEALRLLRQYHRLEPNDLDAKYKIGVAAYHQNELLDADRFLRYVLDNNKKPEPEAYFYLARTAHHNHQFKSAIALYKSYLRRAKLSDDERRSIKDLILRCAYGMRITSKDELAIVENLGNQINSTGDDICPVLSPNYDNKIYFTSARRGNIGGLRNEEGLRDEKYGHYTGDIYASVLMNGVWGATTPLSSLLNSPRHDVIQGFNGSGGVLFFWKTNNQFSGEILVDTFKVNNEERPLFPVPLDGPIIGEEGDRDIFIFQDSIFLFSSRRDGGYGGSDLYVVLLKNGQWEEPKNLGPNINSPYDERTPYLAQDGRTLYFSTNHRNRSMGGFDILTSRFDESTLNWTLPENLGLPINSAGDDQHFRLTKNGMTAYFASSRKVDSKGGFDLYAAYFKNERKEQLADRRGPAFTDLLALNNVATTNEGEPLLQLPDLASQNPITFTEEEIEEYRFNPLYFGDDENLLTPANMRELNKVAKLMKKYAPLKLQLTSFSNYDGPRQYDLYFSAKRIEPVIDYLVTNGINADRIQFRSVGAAYPIAKSETESGPNPLGKRYNRRVDFGVFNADNLPIRVSQKLPNTGNFGDDRYAYFSQVTAGLSYKVQIAAIKQMYNSNLLGQFPDGMVEGIAEDGILKYTLGLYKTFDSADQLRSALKQQGVQDAFVVPYLNGVRIDRDKAMTHSGLYPDLYSYLAKTAP